MNVGDRVLLRRRPKGHDVPGIVRALGDVQGEVLVEIRPGKLVRMLTKKLVVLQDTGDAPFHVPMQHALDALTRLTEAERADVLGVDTKK